MSASKLKSRELATNRDGLPCATNCQLCSNSRVVEDVERFRDRSQRHEGQCRCLFLSPVVVLESTSRHSLGAVFMRARTIDYTARKTRAGSMISAATSSSTPWTAIPTSRNGNKSIHTMG